MTRTDSELLDDFVENGSQGAFSELLRRYVDLVYSASLRQVGCQVQAAEDVTQKVFADLAEKAPQLRGRTTLSGWLYTSTRFAATEHRRAEARRLARESTAHTMSKILYAAGADPDWDQVRPWLDEAMADLGPEDQEAILLRHFEGRSFTEVGARLGLAENTARMRVDRALTKLHTALSHRGVTSTAIALGLAMESHAVSPAPAGLLGRVTTPGRGGVRSSWALKLVRNKFARTSVTLVLVTGLLLVLTRRTASLHSVRAAESSARLGTNLSTASSSSVTTPATIQSAGNPDAETDPAALDTSDRILRLEFIDRATGLPVANVSVVYLAWKQLGENPVRFTFTANRQGQLRIPLDPPLDTLELVSQVDRWADTRLHWQPGQGDEIPTNYVVRLDPGIPLSGRVIDPEGKPLDGGRIEFILLSNGMDPLATESHDFGSAWASIDSFGHWSHSRIAGDVLRRVRIRATSTGYLSSEELNLAESSESVELIQSGRHVAQVRPARKIHGYVEDETGDPILGATVKIEDSIHSPERIAQSNADGRFELQGCPSSNVLLTASSPNFAPRAVWLRTVSPTNQPIRLRLGPAQQLRFQVVSSDGRAISNAWYVYRSESGRSEPELAEISAKPKVGFFGRTDGEGRAEWLESPVGTNRFIIEAIGYKRTEINLAADGKEHPVVLMRSITNAVVYGSITDSKSGRPIANGKVQLGYPARTHELFGGDSAEPPPRFESRGYDGKFSDGTYRFPITVPPLEYFGHMLNFEAAGYQSLETNLMEGFAGEIRLNVTLHPATEFDVSLLLPDGRPAPDVQIALARMGDIIRLGEAQILSGSFPIPELKTSDSRGRVTLTTDSRIDQVVAVHSGGFASVSRSKLEADRVLRLEPWGRINVQFGGSNSTSKKVWIHPSEISSSAVKIDLGEAIRTVDDQGQVSFRHVPPGQWDAVSVHSVGELDGSTAEIPAGDQVSVNVNAGGLIDVRLGGGTRVIGRLHFPAGFVFPAGSRWHGRAKSIHHPLPPIEIRTNLTAVMKWRRQPEIQAQLQREKLLNVGIDKNGRFTLEGVPPGIYDLTAFLGYSVPDAIQPNDGIQRAQFKRLLNARLQFTVPVDSEGAVLDLGTLEVESETTSKDL